MHTFGKSVLFASLILGHPALTAAGSSETPPPSLTIYNQDFGVVRSHIPLKLRAGVNEVSITDISAHVEPHSVILRDPTGKIHLQILEQNYRADPVSQLLLLSRYEGKTIDFLVGGTADAPLKVSGKIIRSGYVPHYNALNGFGSQYYQRQMMLSQQTQSQPLIEVDGQLRFGLPGTPIFPSLTDDSILKPTLNWKIHSDQTNDVTAELAYLTGGMTWRADYNVIAESDDDIVSLLGWVTIENQCGTSFENARIKLMAGDVHRISPDGQANQYLYAGLARRSGVAGNEPGVTEKSFEDYHLYTVARPSTIRDRETKQIEFIRADQIKAERRYVYNGADINWQQYRGWGYDSLRTHSDFGSRSTKKVQVVREFSNCKSNNLGMPLPSGKLRFYRRDDDGQLEFTGENMIDHTPKDELVRVVTGNAFDLVGERNRTNFETDGSKRFTNEWFEIKLRNHKEEPVTITVVEDLYRWRNWEISENDHEFKKKDSDTIEFDVTLAPDEEKTIKYKVHYSW
ncbi:MAG: DUF4139 domain-containing protein [Phycisphaerae bacterium]|nr:MAG: DUF4139 domain-containing protein [Phycisphaerae bacterium]